MSDPIWSEIVPSVLSGASLIAVVAIGFKTVRETGKSTKAISGVTTAVQELATVTQNAAAATERSATAASDLLVATRKLDHLRRLDNVLSVVMDMRDLFNQIYVLGDPDLVNSQPQTLMKLAACRKLEAALVNVANDFADQSPVWNLANQQGWDSGTLEMSVTQVKEIMRPLQAG